MEGGKFKLALLLIKSPFNIFNNYAISMCIMKGLGSRYALAISHTLNFELFVGYIILSQWWLRVITYDGGSHVLS